MKTQVKLSALVVAVMAGLKLSTDKVVQACEATQNSRSVIGITSEGTRNKTKDLRAESAESIAYVTPLTTVTAFIGWAEAEVGAVDKLAKRAGKIGLAVSVTDIPEKFAGQPIREWAIRTGTVKKPAKAATEPAKVTPPAATVVA